LNQPSNSLSLTAAASTGLRRPAISIILDSGFPKTNCTSSFSDVVSPPLVTIRHPFGAYSRERASVGVFELQSAPAKEKSLLLKAINLRDGCKLGEARLVKDRRDWFLDVVVQQQTPTTGSACDVHWRERTFVGVDLGLNSIATSVALQPDGVFYPPMTVPGGTLKNQLRKLRCRRAAADSRRDVEAMRAIETQRRNIIRYWCHVASSRVIDYAKRFKNPVIVLENLETYRVEASQHSAQMNYLLSSWVRGLIKGYITYKAQLCGMQVASVDAYGSTRYCNKCGAWTQYEPSSNRRVLRCIRCGFRVGRDANAAMNLAVRGRYIGIAGLLLLLLGCGNSQTQLPWISEYLKRAVRRALNRQVLPRHRRTRV
jgi:IS605 OrfB family transposase